MSILRVRDADGNVQEILAIKGEPGQDATINIGTVTSVPYDANATVTNSGTASAAILNFEIPRGVDGISPIVIEPYYDENDEVILLSSVEFENIKESFNIGVPIIVKLDGTVYNCVDCSNDLATFTSISRETDVEGVSEYDEELYGPIFRIKTIAIYPDNIVECFGYPPTSHESVPTIVCMENYVQRCNSYQYDEIVKLQDDINNLYEDISKTKASRLVVELKDLGEGTYSLLLSEEETPEEVDIIEQYLYDMYCQGYEIYLRYNDNLCHCISFVPPGRMTFEMPNTKIVNGYLKQTIQHFIYDFGTGYFTDEVTLDSLNIIDGKVKLNLTSIGDLALSGGRLTAIDTDSMEHLHTMPGTAVVVPANTLITLTSFEANNSENTSVPVSMSVYYSYDNGNSYQLKELNEDDQKFYTEKEAVIALSIDCSAYVDEDGYTQPGIAPHMAEELIVIDIYTVSEHIKDTDDHFNDQDAHGLNAIRELLNSLSERVSALEKLISHGTAEPTADLETKYYIRYEE